MKKPPSNLGIKIAPAAASPNMGALYADIRKRRAVDDTNNNNNGAPTFRPETFVTTRADVNQMRAIGQETAQLKDIQECVVRRLTSLQNQIQLVRDWGLQKPGADLVAAKALVYSIGADMPVWRLKANADIKQMEVLNGVINEIMLLMAKAKELALLFADTGMGSLESLVLLAHRQDFPRVQSTLMTFLTLTETYLKALAARRKPAVVNFNAIHKRSDRETVKSKETSVFSGGTNITGKNIDDLMALPRAPAAPAVPAVPAVVVADAAIQAAEEIQVAPRKKAAIIDRTARRYGISAGTLITAMITMQLLYGGSPVHGGYMADRSATALQPHMPLGASRPLDVTPSPTTSLIGREDNPAQHDLTFDTLDTLDTLDTYDAVLPTVHLNAAPPPGHIGGFPGILAGAGLGVGAAGTLYGVSQRAQKRMDHEARGSPRKGHGGQRSPRKVSTRELHHLLQGQGGPSRHTRSR